MGNYKDLKVWQKSIDFVLEIYKITAKFPNEEKFGLISQMRRAAVSVASNIAEGSTSRSKNDFGRFIGISKGSLAELETQLLISFKLGFITEDIYKEIINYSELLSRMLSGLKQSLM
jgi:four helix bundle protein